MTSCQVRGSRQWQGSGVALAGGGCPPPVLRQNRLPFARWPPTDLPSPLFNADQRRRADHNVGHPLRAETLLDAELISRYGVPPLDTAERPWIIPLPDFDNRPLAAATAPL